MASVGIPTLLLLLAAGGVQQDSWPRFRGPTGQGLTAEKGLPLEWDGASGKNLRWTSPVVGEGHASPIVIGGKVIVCTVRWPGGKQDPKVMPEHHVQAFAASDGKPLWDRVLEPGPWLRSDFRSGPGGGYAAPTPASDGTHVIVVFGSSVMASLDLSGNVAWRKVIRPFSFDVTIGSSPVLHGETVILLCAMARKEDSRLVAFSKTDGSVAWETRLPGTRFGHSTPLLITVRDHEQLVTVASGMGKSPDAIQGFDPADGRRIWWAAGAGDASSPVYGSGILYADSGRGGIGTAIDPSGSGELGADHVKWTTRPMAESIASPVIGGHHVFRLHGSGVVKAWRLDDGKEEGRVRLEGLGSRWASPIVDGNGRIYFATAGRSYVVEATAEMKVLARNDLGDPHHASPAVAGGRLFLLGRKNLFCVGSR